MGRVTLVDVAQRAGVSRATASLVLNNSPLVADATRERVRVSMRELGYIYDRSAAALRRSRTDAIGIVAPEFSHAYLSPFVAGVQEVLEAEGMIVLAGVTHDDPAAQARLMTAMLERKLDGLVVIPANGTTPADLTGLGGTPLVQLVRRVPGVASDYVGADNTDGARRATIHLVLGGARSVAFVGGLPHFSSYGARLAGTDSALVHVGLPAARAHPCEPTRPAARAAAAAAIAAGADALVCYSDRVAFGALDAAAAAGLAVPRDLQVCGFDDVPDAEYSSPPLTTVATSGALAGHEAARLLLRRLAGDGGPPEEVIVPTTLVPRSTTRTSPRSATSAPPISPGSHGAPGTRTAHHDD